MNSFSCFYDSEIKKIYQIYQKIHNAEDLNNSKEMYNELLKHSKCQDSDPDKCIYKTLIDEIPQEYKQYLDDIYFKAKPLPDKPEKHQWLDNFIIMDACFQIQQNSTQNYVFGGIALYDDFEYALTDEKNKLSPSRIISTLKKNIPQQSTKEQDINKIISDDIPTQQKTKQRKSKIGFVLNTCHKFSSGQHWVGMGITYFPDKNRIDIDYFDSQGDYGFETKALTCDTTSSDTKYKHYVPKAKEWLQYFKQVAQKQGIDTIFYSFNKFHTQHDNFSCGYHAILFNYLLSRIDEPIQVIYLLVQSEKGKDLDDFIPELQQQLYGSGKKNDGGFRVIEFYTY